MPIELTNVVNAPPLRILFSEGTTKTLVVSCSGVGTVRSEDPPPQFVKIATQGGRNPALFVTDKSRSWMNGPNMADTIASTITETAQRVGAETIVGIGDSMGATMVMHLAPLVGFDSVLALTPQYSVNPSVVPKEKRWKYFRKQIETFQFDRLDELDCARTKFYIVHGDGAGELEHALRFPRVFNGVHFILPGYDHKLSKKIKKQGKLDELANLAIAGRTRHLRHALEDLGGQFISRYLADHADNRTKDLSD